MEVGRFDFFNREVLGGNRKQKVFRKETLLLNPGYEDGHFGASGLSLGQSYFS